MANINVSYQEINSTEVKERFGAWPGEGPELTEGLIVGPTTAP